MRRFLISVAHVVGNRQYCSNSKLIGGTALSFSNQNLSGEISATLLSIKDQFDHMGVQFSFGYGSGVIPQAGYKPSSNPQLDLIHIVENTVEFHRINAAKFPAHYSSFIHCNEAVLKYVQEYGAGVYFNPYVKMKGASDEDVVVKYGVVSRQRALEDLKNWTSFYIAGRLQKPVQHFHGVSDDLKAANEYNLESAFNLSLLTTASNGFSYPVTTVHLFEQIASISYVGDPRMLVGGENPNKVENMVKSQLPFFEKLYSKAIEKAIMQKYLRKQGNSYFITLNFRSVAEIVARLPPSFKKKLLSVYKKKYYKVLSQDEAILKFLNEAGNGSLHDINISHHGVGPFICEISRDPSFKNVILSTISNTVAFPAFAQSIKGILTAGFGKSLKYAWEKKLKGWAL